MSNKIVPKEFPATVEGKGTVWMSKADYIKVVSGQFAVKYEADINKGHIQDMLSAIEAGKENIPDDAPPEFHKVWARVKEDWAEAVEKVKEDEQKALEEKAKAEAEEKERLAKEEKTVAANAENFATFGDLAKFFDTGEHMDRFVPKKGVTLEQKLGAFNASLKMGEFNKWMIGDLIASLESDGQLGVVTKLAEKQGTPFSTLYRYALTAKNVPPDQRKPGVPFTIYDEFARRRLTDKKGTEGDVEHNKNFTQLLDRVNKVDEKGKSEFTSQTIREEVNKLTGKTTATPSLPEEDEKREFLVIPLGEAETGEEVFLTKGFPKDDYKEGTVVVVDLKTGLRFAENGFAKAKENRWLTPPAFVTKAEREAAEKEAKEKAAAAKPKKKK